MDLQFDGFQNSVPVLWITLLLAASLGLSIWTYRNADMLSRSMRWLLGSLRAATFFLLILLLLNPVFAFFESFEQPVQIALVLDNSQSTTIAKGGYEGESGYREIIRRIESFESFHSGSLLLNRYAFDTGLFPLDHPDSLHLNGTRTDIDRAISDLMDQLDREEAVILVTDGIVTSGRDPSSTASRFPLPVYTIGIGDTTRLNDLAVQRILHNPAAQINSRIPVDVWVLNDGFPHQEIAVQLRQNELILDEKTVISSETRSVQQVQFNLELHEEGLQEFQVHIPEVEGEWSTVNNTRYFTVDVRDDRLRILHLSFDMHPDVGHLRHFLARDQLVSLETRTWISGDLYIEENLPDRPDTLDLVILHGFPNRGLSSEHAAQIANRFGEQALLFFGSPAQDVTRLSTLFPGLLPLQFEAGFSWNETGLYLLVDPSEHAILDFNQSEELRMPAIRGAISQVQLRTGAISLLGCLYRGEQTGKPLLAVRSSAGRNITIFNGYNFFLWALHPREEIRNHAEQLLNNMIKWTASPPDEQLLTLSPAESVFEAGEPVIIQASLRNEAGELEENAIIELVLQDGESDQRSFVMSNEGNGQYSLEISNLAQGSYHYSGLASRAGREIDQHRGQFSVGGIHREFVNTIRNDDLLHYISMATGGAFMPHEQASELLSVIENEVGFETRTETRKQSLPQHRQPFWFVMVIVLLTVEWILRKYHALA